MTEDLRFSLTTEAVAAPGERFEPADLLALSGAHADAGDWVACLDVLETVKEVSRVARTAVTAKSNELLLAKGVCGRDLVRIIFQNFFCFFYTW